MAVSGLVGLSVNSIVSSPLCWPAHKYAACCLFGIAMWEPSYALMIISNQLARCVRCAVAVFGGAVLLFGASHFHYEGKA